MIAVTNNDKNNNGWRKVTINDIKANVPNAIAIGPFGSNIKADNFVSCGVPVIRGINLTEGRFREQDFVFVTKRKADELHSANAFPGDIVFTHRGTIGQVSIIPKDGKYSRYIISQSQMKLTCNTTKVDPLFIYYFFRSPQGQNSLLINTCTTGVRAIAQPLTSLKRISIMLPPLPNKELYLAY